MPDASDGLDTSLEGSAGGGHWDQFAANERLFGLKTDYDENIYTTAINKSHPQYRERIAAAERKAREIERSTPTTAHVAEERIMDYNGTSGGDDNEEDKYAADATTRKSTGSINFSIGTVASGDRISRPLVVAGRIGTLLLLSGRLPPNLALRVRLSTRPLSRRR